MKTLELSDDDIRVLRELINIALKATGLDAAEAAVYFKNKLNAL